MKSYLRSLIYVFRIDFLAGTSLVALNLYREVFICFNPFQHTCSISFHQYTRRYLMVQTIPLFLSSRARCCTCLRRMFRSKSCRQGGGKYSPIVPTSHPRAIEPRLYFPKLPVVSGILPTLHRTLRCSRRGRNPCSCRRLDRRSLGPLCLRLLSRGEILT